MNTIDSVDKNIESKPIEVETNSSNFDLSDSEPEDNISPPINNNIKDKSIRIDVQKLEN